MTPGISGSILSELSFVDATMPPRDPNDDEDEEDEEDGGDADDYREPAVIRETGRRLELISKSSKKDHEAGRQLRRLEPRTTDLRSWGGCEGWRAFSRMPCYLECPWGSSRSIRRHVCDASIDQRADVTTSFVPGYRTLWPSCSRGPLHRRYMRCDLDCPRRFELRRRMDSDVYIRKHRHERIGS